MNIVKNIISVFSTQILEKLIRQINSIILARFIGPAGLGIYSLFFSLAQNFFIFFEFGLGSSGIFHIRRKINKEREIIENVVIISLITGLVSSIIVLIFKNQISEILLDGNPLYILLLSLVIPIIILSSIFSIISRGIKRFDIYNSFILIRPISFLALIFIFVVSYADSIIMAVIAQISSIFIAGIWILFKLYRLYPFKLKFHKKVFIQNFIYGYKQHILKISLMFLGSVQIYILKYFSTSEVVGQYAIVLSMVALVALFKSSISFVLTPAVSDLNEEETHIFIKNVTKYTFYLTLISSIIVGFVGSYYVKILYGQKFDYASNAFIFFLPGIVFHSTCVILHRDFTNRPKPNQFIPIFAYSIGAISITLSSYFLISEYSNYPLEATALAYSISHLIVFIILLMFFKSDSGYRIMEIFCVSRNDIFKIKENVRKLIRKKIVINEKKYESNQYSFKL